jgi:class 3 adenylate cyclase/predicted ATPase
LPEIVGGRYRVLADLGHGAMGRVVKVEHLHTGEALAMKLLLTHRRLDSDLLERFRREARALAQVRSEYVVRILDADISAEFDSTPYIVMELLHGEDLGRYAARRGPLDGHEVVGLLEQVARGLHRVHQAGLAHRDLKPANIFLHHQDDRLVVKLLDFGLVKARTGANMSFAALTQDGAVIGTPLFMSPEQVQGIAHAVGPPADIWSVGIIAFHLLTGRPYWNLDILPRGVLDIGATALTPPTFLEPSLSVAFDGWFLRSCARNPPARWPDPLTQWRELARALGVPATPPSGSASAVLAVATGTPYPEVEPTRTCATPGPEGAVTISLKPGQQPGPARQRRQVTVLFYRLVHGDRRTHDMDPEEFETLDVRIQTSLDEPLGELLQTGSHLARGGRCVFFGYPVAYGDDARRAVEAGLRLVEVTRGLDAQLRAEGRGSLGIRLGAHTGLVLTGSPDLVGPALGVAAELEHQAAPGQLLVSATTWRLLGGRFRGERLGGNPEEAPFVVLGALGEPASGAASALPMVGRQAEFALLLSCLEEVRYGNGQTILVTGEVGLGKSRLLQTLREKVVTAQTAWLECHCSPYFQRSPFHPLIALVKSTIQQAAGRAGTEALCPADIQAAAKALTLDAALTPVVELLLSFPPADPSVIEQWSPQLRRERTIETLISLLHHRAAAGPLVFVVEDLHWADPSTLEFLDRLSVVGDVPLLAVLTARPDFTPAWTSPAAITPVQLRRLPPQEAARLVAQVAGHGVTEEVVAQLVRRTDGIPLFIEEASRLLFDRTAPGAGGETPPCKGDPAGDLPLIGAVPTTLRDALNARLDRLGTARGLAQFAAVLGQEFQVEDLGVLWPGEASGLQTHLRELVRLKVFQPRGLPPHAGYAFQHALLRDAAYDSLPREARRDIHGQIARALASRTTGLATRPELLAHHFAEGGMAREAAGLLLQAGQAALRNSANAEARSHFQRGIDVLGQIEQTPADTTLEITLRTLEGMTWVVSRGYAVPEVQESFAGALARIGALAQEESPELLPALWAQWVFQLVRGFFREAQESSRRLLLLAGRCPDAGVALLAHLAHGTTLHGLGRFEEAVAHLEEGIRHYDPEAHAGYRYIYGQDPFMFGSVFEAWALWCLGFPDRAAELADRALAHAEGLRHPNSLGFALAIAAIIRHYRGEAVVVAQLAQALRRLSTEQGWIQWMGHAQLWAGAADVLQGRIEVGVAAMREARQLAERAGEKSGGTHYDAILIDGLCQAGWLDEAAERITQAKAQLVAVGEYAFEADLLRLEAEVARQRGDAEGARRLFGQALASATGRKSRSYELRAALSLARHERAQQLSNGEGQARLARVLGEFTEGFDTADLRAARAEAAQCPMGEAT